MIVIHFIQMYQIKFILLLFTTFLEHSENQNVLAENVLAAVNVFLNFTLFYSHYLDLVLKCLFKNQFTFHCIVQQLMRMH